MNNANSYQSGNSFCYKIPVVEREQLFYVLALIAKNPPSFLGQVEFVKLRDLEWPSALFSVRVQYGAHQFDLVIEQDRAVRVWEFDEHSGMLVYSDKCKELERWVVSVAETCDFSGVNSLFALEGS